MDFVEICYSNSVRKSLSLDTNTINCSTRDVLVYAVVFFRDGSCCVVMDPFVTCGDLTTTRVVRSLNA